MSCFSLSRETPSSCRTSCRIFPSARRSASRFPAVSTRAPRCTGCARRARFRTRTPRISASPTSRTTTRSRGARCSTARKAQARRLPRGARRRGDRGAAGGRVPHLDGGADLLQHDAARARRHRHDARRRDARRRRPHLGRRQHVQGQRHRALLPLRAARQPEPAHLQAVARRDVHRRARRPQGDVGVPDPRRLRLPDERGEGVLDRLEPAGRDARGEGPRVPGQGHEDRRADHGCGVLARRRRRQARDGRRTLRRGTARSR